MSYDDRDNYNSAVYSLQDEYIKRLRFAKTPEEKQEVISWYNNKMEDVGC